MAVTQLRRPIGVRKYSQFPSYQLSAATMSLPAGKSFGITKRMHPSIVSAQSLLSKVTKLRAEADPDVNNGNVPYDRTWVTATVAMTGAQKADINQGYNNSNFINGQNITLDYYQEGVTPNDIISNTKKYTLKDGQQIYPNGLTVNISIPQNGIVRFNVINNSGGTINLGNSVFYVRIFKPVVDIAQAIYNFGVRKGTTLFAELVENGIPAINVEQIFAGVSQLIKQNEGVTDINANSIIADYYDGLNGYSTDVSFIASGETQASLEAKLSSVTAARGTSAYYSNQAYDYRHRLISGYFDGIRLCHGGAYIYQTIYNLERAFMAMSNRKTAVFGWGSFEGVDGYVEARATQQRLRFPGKGDLIRTVRPEGSFKMVEAQALYALLIGNEYEMWHDSSKYGTNLNCFDLSYIGGADPGKNKFQKLGGSIEAYNENDPGQVKSNCSGDEARWADTGAPSQNAAFCGAYRVAQLTNRLNISLKYANFSYEEQGTTKNGYFNGNIPVSGNLGDASVSRYGVSNPGQNNIVKQWYNKKPIVMEGVGNDGGVIIICHPSAKISGSKVYNINSPTFGNLQVPHIGTSVGIYLIN